MITQAIRELLIHKAALLIVKVDVAEAFPVGYRFDMDILNDPRAEESINPILEVVLDKTAGVDLQALRENGVYEVVFIAQGAPADLVCRDAEGVHFCIPSGVLAVLKKCAGGDFPPPLPKADEEAEKALADDLRKIVDDLNKAA